MNDMNVVLEAKLEEYQYERKQAAQSSNLPIADVGISLRRGAGDALISLGTWIKPRGQSRHLKLNSARLAGR